MSDLKEALDGAGDGAGEGGEKVEKRFNQMTATIKTKEEENAQLFIENLSLKDPRYKRAGEFKEKIMEKVRSGIPVADATSSVLVSENAFEAPAAAAAGDGGAGDGAGAGGEGAGNGAGSGAGGSADININNLRDKKEIKDMTQQEKLDALAEEEKSGGIFLT